MTLPNYKAYTDTGVSWFPNSPDHWRVSRLKFDTYIKARVGWHGLTSDDFTDEGPYLVTGTDFVDSSINWSNCKHCDIERYEQDPFIQLKNGDLLVTKDGTIGKLALVDDLPDKACLNSGVFVLRPEKKAYLTRYYYWMLRSRVFDEFIRYFQTGSTINHLYQDTFSQFSYALPPIHEQASITIFLDNETARIDRLIEKQQQLIALLKEKRQAVISHAVTKGLDPNVPMKDSGVEWLGEVPEHWDVARVKFVAKLESGHTPSKQVKEYWIDCDIPWVSLNDSKQLAHVDYISETAYKINEQGLAGSSARLLPPGAVVFTRDATIGLTAITTREMAVSQHLIAWLPRERILSLFLLRVFNAMNAELVRFTFGATIKTIGMDDVKALIATVPPLDEQKEICQYIDEKLASFDLLIGKAEHQIGLLRERRLSLIASAVTGKIDVRNHPSAQPTNKEVA